MSLLRKMTSFLRYATLPLIQKSARGIQRRSWKRLQYLADALGSPLSEDEGSAGQHIVCEVQEAEPNRGSLACLQSLSLLDGQHLGRLPQHPTVNHRLVAASDCGGVMENHLTIIKYYQD